VVRNISERKQVEADLRESEQRFKELADALPQTVFELNLDGMITFVNRTALDTFGHTQPDIDKGMHALHMIVPEQRITVRENIEKVFAGERLGGQEYMALRKDGTTFPCIIHASPILADGKPQGLRGLLIDITLRKELEEQMNKSNRLASIATLAGGVAQDFNTILSIILGNINLAQHQVAPEDRVSEHLAAAERATLRAKDLTDQLIAFSKGGTALKTALSVEKLLRDAANTALKGSNVTCQFSFPPDLQHTELDELQMRQVFINLLINADHAMPEGGSIDVSALNITVGPGDNLPLPNGAYVKITISDQSIGILNEHLQQLFDPYFTSRQRGSGIGLATTYTIIKNHGGLITVESEFGSGTTFHIFLPACGNKR
jgi:PAS domain S-box-containing protein